MRLKSFVFVCAARLDSALPRTKIATACAKTTSQPSSKTFADLYLKGNRSLPISRYLVECAQFGSTLTLIILADVDQFRSKITQIALISKCVFVFDDAWVLSARSPCLVAAVESARSEERAVEPFQAASFFFDPTKATHSLSARSGVRLLGQTQLIRARQSCLRF